ncbi:uncharacterized protein BJX67DRAFT_379944 [Aspergillus lucknowensis]|uniref:Uncharacterized protein n=1 Tax=Aspergillus lucknowensis TaxID=176173 RepID=A0ABR4LVS0_9EURO
MDAQRFVFRPESRSQIASSFVRRAPNYELCSDQELASSKPVSLIQLYSKTSHSRNKAMKNAKRFDPGGSGHIAEVGRDAVLHRFDNFEHYSQSSLPHSNTGKSDLDDGTENPTPPSRLDSREYSWRSYRADSEISQGQTWRPGMEDYHPQKNPLSYASYHDSTKLRESSCVSESPCVQKAGQDRILRETWSVDMTPAFQVTQYDTPESVSFVQKTQLPKQYTPASSLQLYRESFDRPNDKSPYESFRLKLRNNRTDLPEITSGLQYGYHPDPEYDQYTGNTTIRSEPTISTHYRERLPTFDVATKSREIQQAAHKTRKLPEAHSKLSSRTTSVSQRTLKEEIYAILDNLSLGPNSDSHLTPIPQDSEPAEAKSMTTPDQLLKHKREPSITLAPDIQRGGSVESTKSNSAVHVSNSEEKSFESHCESGTTDKSRVEPSVPGVQVGQELAIPFNSPDTPAVRGIRPPPGLPGLLHEGDPAASSVETRLKRANAWFHTDGRGENQLRRHIANIAENFVDRSERLNGHAFSSQDRITTKQIISAFGDAIANLHAYASLEKGEQAKYFADFKPVEPRYCESPLGVRRSYFDWDPIFDSWKSHETALNGDGSVN